MAKSAAPAKTAFQRVLSAVGVVLSVLFGALVVCNLAVIVQGFQSPERPPAILGYTPMIVRSGSMSGDNPDSFEVNDLIVVGQVDADKLAVGDVVASMVGPTVVTHRVVEVQTAEDGSPRYITQGDANDAPDAEPVLPENVVGRYVTHVPGIGSFALFLQKPLGMVLFVGVPLIAFIVIDGIARGREDAENRKRTAALEAELESLKNAVG